MRFRFSSLAPKLRVVGFFFVSFLIWGVWSIPPLLSFDHAGFQAAGTVIKCWAIFFIGRDRLNFERSVSRNEHEVLVAALNRLEAHRSVDEQRLNLTFDIHQLQISNICHTIGLKNPSGPQSLGDLEAFRRSIEETIRRNPQEYRIEEDGILVESYSAMLHARTEYGRWATFTFAAELAFLISGTLQTGYGAHFSKLVAEAGITARLNYLLNNILP